MSRSRTIFLRLLAHDDKAAALSAAVEALRSGAAHPHVFHADPASFAQVPGSPMAYWVGEQIRSIFRKYQPLERHNRVARRGPSTSDDFWRVRVWWEVSVQTNSGNQRWVTFAKGGSYAPYYVDIPTVAGWDDNRSTFIGFFGRPGRMIERPESLEYFFRPGLSWPLRAGRFSPFIMPKGAIFSARGYALIESPVDDVLKTQGLLNSLVFDFMFKILLGRFEFPEFVVGVLQQLPIPPLDNPLGTRLGELALACVELKRNLDRANETSHVFHLPALLQVPGATLAGRAAAWQARVAEAEAQLAANQREIDEIAFQIYGIEGEDRRAIEEGLNHRDTEAQSEDEIVENDEESSDESAPSFDPLSLCASVVSYLVGCAFGRFDIRYATGERPTPVLPDPFAPLPACSPGMLTGNDGLPLLVAPEGYPLQLDADGILVDDPDHEDDVVRRVRAAFDVVFGKRAEAIEREACQILGVDDLRDYFRRPGKGGFWDDHIKRYSKSRRKAPIYWLLQSPKRSYALWLYYHRLDKDTLFKALVSYVEPKIRLERERLTGMQSRRAGLAGRELRQLEREIERQEALIGDLQDFRDRLVRAAHLYLEPDLNDGVVLTIAPLWELVPWKKAKQYWNELLAGKYEWSSIGKRLRAKGLVNSRWPINR